MGLGHSGWMCGNCFRSSVKPDCKNIFHPQYILTQTQTETVVHSIHITLSCHHPLGISFHAQNRKCVFRHNLMGNNLPSFSGKMFHVIQNNFFRKIPLTKTDFTHRVSSDALIGTWLIYCLNSYTIHLLNLPLARDFPFPSL